jgi:hypothetical protein
MDRVIKGAGEKYWSSKLLELFLKLLEFFKSVFWKLVDHNSSNQGWVES